MSEWQEGNPRGGACFIAIKLERLPFAVYPALEVQHIFALLAKSAPVLRSLSGPHAVLMTDHMPASFVTCSRVLPRDLMYEIAVHVAKPDKDDAADDYDKSAVQLASLALVNKAWHAVCSPLIWKVSPGFHRRGAPLSGSTR